MQCIIVKRHLQIKVHAEKETMHCFGQLVPSLVLTMILTPADAFRTVSKRPNLVARCCNYKAESLDRRIALHQSSDGGDDGSSTINIALVSSPLTEETQHELQTTIRDHPFCSMTGAQLTVADVPSTDWSPEHLRRLGRTDIVCFASASSVRSYLRRLDEHLRVPEDASDEERRALPNAPAGAASTAGGAFMAACPDADAARECLNSGRWASNHIYYPKDTQPPVELKTAPAGGGEESTGEEEAGEVEDIDTQLWADSVVQAAGDVMERKFWGGGW